MSNFLQSTNGIVQEIMRIHRSLPPRPSIEDIEASVTLIKNVDKEEQSKINSISKQSKGDGVPEELFFVLLSMQKNLVLFQSKEQKREAMKLLDLEDVHNLFDEIVQRASKCVQSFGDYSRSEPVSGSDSVLSSSFSSLAATISSSGHESCSGSSGFSSEKDFGRNAEKFTKDDSYLKKTKPAFYEDTRLEFSRGMPGSSFKRPAITGFPVDDGQKLNLIKLASLIEASFKNGTSELHLSNKLMDQIDWLPDSIGKLSDLVTLNLSENRIVTLPSTIKKLFSLTRLDLHSNQLSELPESFGDLSNLVYLNLKANKLSSLPPTFSKLSHLSELDLSLNQFSILPDTIGNLIKLRKLNVETNDLEEIPHTIGNCTSLVELRADYNRLKALPEAIGKLESLECLYVRYNNIKNLPTTMGSLSNLKEIDVSFNELESIPESLCFATSIVKMNIGNNFADLQSLPRSIGNLEMLEELDISNNQIRVLPDSFRMLLNLRVLLAEENPLEVPPKEIVEKGPQAVLNYMSDHVAKRNARPQTTTVMKSWSPCCFLPNKRKHDTLSFACT